MTPYFFPLVPDIAKNGRPIVRTPDIEEYLDQPVRQLLPGEISLMVSVNDNVH